LVAILPRSLKAWCYRAVYGYRIDPHARIGLALLDAERVEIEAGAYIGHLNLVTRVKALHAERGARVGSFNIIRGGERVHLGPHSLVMRLNVLNAIPDHDCTTEPVSVLEIGAGTVITQGHRIDFTDRVTLGKNVIIGGRNSSLWTHDRQETAPIEIGDYCYLGSEVRLAPGATLPSECVLGMGAVLTGKIEAGPSLVAGVPAKVVKPLDERDIARLRHKTRTDTPDDSYERD
jgi:acetyltransferase-like isoleucine patch superfamily enzyme